MEKLKIAIAVDDVHPEAPWGIPTDGASQIWLNVMKSHNIKFTFFVPANYMGQYPLSKHNNWIQFWMDRGVELAAHGWWHQQKESEDVREFLTDSKTCEININNIINEWGNTLYGIPRGWKFPGWEFNPVCCSIIDKHFEYVAAHPLYDLNFKKARVIGPPRSIHEFSSSDIQKGSLILTSHVANSINQNLWTPENIKHLFDTLEELSKTYELEFVHYGDII
jgi:peptidoglycan/xylan/chitin deacetylase (PgdA/CDA1 family)